MAKWFGLVRGWSTAAETNIHQLILKSISNFSYQLMKCVSASAHQPLTKPNQLATKLIFFIFRFISPIYLTSPSYLSIEVNKIAFWLFWYLFSKIGLVLCPISQPHDFNFQRLYWGWEATRSLQIHIFMPY